MILQGKPHLTVIKFCQKIIFNMQIIYKIFNERESFKREKLQENKIENENSEQQYKEPIDEVSKILL